MKTAFRLDKANGKIAGVCAGIANHFNIDATLVRVGLVALTILGGFPWTLIAYGVTAWVAKPKRHDMFAGDRIATPRGSHRDVTASMRDIDRRMAEVESYVTNPSSRLSREIEELR